jgi:metal-responsive CopG/Arc/MetJ family transcriptional regulator
MAEITIPDELLERVERAVPEAVSTEEFVADAVRDKLAWQQRKAELYRLSDETRQRMDEKGVSEADLLRDFEGLQESLTHG